MHIIKQMIRTHGRGSVQKSTGHINIQTPFNMHDWELFGLILHIMLINNMHTFIQDDFH